MNVPINDIVVLLILTIIHIVAIVFTIKMGRVFESKSWNFITAALILLLLRRVASFLALFGIISYSGGLILEIDQVYLPLIFWILVGIGMVRLYYNIKSSMTIDRRLKRAKDTRRTRRKNRR